MKLLVDGVCFQWPATAIHRLWSAILPRLAAQSDIEIALLDRGSCPAIAGIEQVEFPSYTTGSSTAADSLLIEQLCADLKIDVFTSTYYTTPLSVPSVLLVYDMIPEVLGCDQGDRTWQEKRLAISFASFYACVSETTLLDLQRFHPSTRGRAFVAPCGVEPHIFRPRERTEVETLRERLRIPQSYYLLVCPREHYKNAGLVLSAARAMHDREIAFVCVGAEPEFPSDLVESLPRNVRLQRVDLADEELACAYCGADALIVPSLYEGRGLSVCEAMACGCPVISTTHGALRDVAADAVIAISGQDEEELRRAMERVRPGPDRQRLIESGFRQAGKFNWDDLVRVICELLGRAMEDGCTQRRKDFFSAWKALRTVQAEVDVAFFRPGVFEP